jgi:hypothetical protein
MVFWKYVSSWSYFIIFAMLPSLFLYISPHVSFGSQAPGVGEVVDFLVLAHVFELARPDEVGPHAVPGAGAVTGCYHVKTSCLKCINNTVINMRLRDFKCQVAMWLKLILSDHLDSVLLEWSLHLQERWIIKENGGLTTRNWSIVKHNGVVRRSLEK